MYRERRRGRKRGNESITETFDNLIEVPLLLQPKISIQVFEFTAFKTDSPNTFYIDLWYDIVYRNGTSHFICCLEMLSCLNSNINSDLTAYMCQWSTVNGKKK